MPLLISTAIQGADRGAGAARAQRARAGVPLPPRLPPRRPPRRVRRLRRRPRRAACLRHLPSTTAIWLSGRAVPAGPATPARPDRSRRLRRRPAPQPFAGSAAGARRDADGLRHVRRASPVHRRRRARRRVWRRGRLRRRGVRPHAPRWSRPDRALRSRPDGLTPPQARPPPPLRRSCPQAPLHPAPFLPGEARPRLVPIHPPVLSDTPGRRGRRGHPATARRANSGARRTPSPRC